MEALGNHHWNWPWEKVKTYPDYSDPVWDREYTHTVIFAGAVTAEGGDRGDFGWD